MNFLERVVLLGMRVVQLDRRPNVVNSKPAIYEIVVTGQESPCCGGILQEGVRDRSGIIQRRNGMSLQSIDAFQLPPGLKIGAPAHVKASYSSVVRLAHYL